MLDDHYGGPRPASSRKVWPRSDAERELYALGEVAAAFITGAAASGSTRLSGELVELNAVAAAHGQGVFLAALAPGPSRSGAGAPAMSAPSWLPAPGPPTGTGEALVIDLPVAAGRSLDQYAPTASAATS